MLELVVGLYRATRRPLKNKDRALIALPDGDKGLVSNAFLATISPVHRSIKHGPARGTSPIGRARSRLAPPVEVAVQYSPRRKSRQAGTGFLRDMVARYLEEKKGTCESEALAKLWNDSTMSEALVVEDLLLEAHIFSLGIGGGNALVRFSMPTCKAKEGQQTYSLAFDSWASIVELQPQVRQLH